MRTEEGALQRTGVQWLFVGLLSVIAALATGAAVLQTARANAQVEVEAVHSELELALATLSVRMASLAAGLQQGGPIDPDLFRDLYAQSERMSLRVPERAMALMPSMADEAAIVAATDRLASDYSALGYPEFRLFPDPPAEALFPAMLVEPDRAREAVFGFNIGSSAERLLAARDALDRRVMTTTVPVALSQDNDPSRRSFLLLYPVYFNDASNVFGTPQAVLGAGMTPAALFTNHVPIFQRKKIDVVIELGGVSLPVALQGSPAWGYIPVINELEMPVIRTPGFDVPFRASARFAPTLLDVLLVLVAATVAGALGFLAFRVSNAKTAHRIELETTLRAREAQLDAIHRSQARSQRLEALGRLVGGIAHDFNNILSVILGNLELIQKTRTTPDEAPMIEDAIEATHRGARLTRQLLSAGSKSHLEPRPIDVTRVLRDGAEMLRRVLPETIEMRIVPAAGLWTIEADPDALQGALLNLGINARDAMDGSGSLVIEAVNTRVGDSYIAERPDEDLALGRYVAISFTDTGTGMSRDVMERAFEPFFSTKHATEGSGLGLPSVLGFCRQTGGTCRIYSELGVGTTVRMLFPASDTGTVDIDPAATATPDARPAKARILLAEDEDSVARVIEKQLAAAGYHVTRVNSGDAAWTQIEDGRDRYDLLITDLVMPGTLQGVALTQRAETLSPPLPVILVSGYPQEGAIETNGVGTRHDVLTKPVRRSDLLHAVEKVLSTAPR